MVALTIHPSLEWIMFSHLWLLLWHKIWQHNTKGEKVVCLQDNKTIKDGICWNGYWMNGVCSANDVDLHNIFGSRLLLSLVLVPPLEALQCPWQLKRLELMHLGQTICHGVCSIASAGVGMRMRCHGTHVEAILFLFSFLLAFCMFLGAGVPAQHDLWPFPLLTLLGYCCQPLLPVTKPPHQIQPLSPNPAIS